MDWTKAKTILIMALLMTNVFLVGLYMISNAGNESDDIQIQADTVALLEEKNIFVNTGLPVGHQKMPMLNVEFNNIDENFIKKKLYDQKPLVGTYGMDEQAVKITENFLKICDLWSPDIFFDKMQENQGKYVLHYRREYEGNWVEGNYVICSIESGIIKKIEILWFKPVGFGKSKKETISASAALIAMMRNKEEKEDIFVEAMEMVYWLDISPYGGETAVSDTALPAWKVTYNEGKIKYIPAYSE